MLFEVVLIFLIIILYFLSFTMFTTGWIIHQKKLDVDQTYWSVFTICSILFSLLILGIAIVGTWIIPALPYI